MKGLIHRTLCECTSDEFAAAFRLIFEDLSPPPPAHYDGTAFERRYAFEHLDRVASRFVTSPAGPVAALLIARRGRVSHISGFGVAPSHRRQGIGRRLLATACADATERGDSRMLVEVSTTAWPALAMYQSLGFRRTRRLVGFVRTMAPAVDDPGLTEIEPDAVARLIGEQGPPDLPWFFHPASLAGSALPTRAYALEDNAFAIATPRNGDVSLRALFVHEAARRQGLARRLIDAIIARHRASSCSVVPLVPEGLASEFFTATAFQVAELTHEEMERPL